MAFHSLPGGIFSAFFYLSFILALSNPAVYTTKNILFDFDAASLPALAAAFVY